MSSKDEKKVKIAKIISSYEETIMMLEHRIMIFERCTHDDIHTHQNMKEELLRQKCALQAVKEYMDKHFGPSS